MVQEEQPHHRYSNSSSGGAGGGAGAGAGAGGSGGSGGGGGASGGRSSKRLKQKKIPQRGLGVAQLERIRLEEQQKKDAAATPIRASPPPCLGAAPFPQHHHHPSTSIPFPRSPIDLSSSNSPFRSSSVSIPNLDVYCQPPPPPPPPPRPPPPSPPPPPPPPPGGGGGGVSDGSSMGGSEMSAYVPATWNPCEFPHEGEGPKFDPGFAFRSHLPNESTLIWPPMPRKQQPSSNSMVNICLSASSSSGLILQMEPPSNQSYYSNFTPHLWPEEEKMVGMKRPWPFSLDHAPGSSECKLPSFVPPICRLDESSSSGNNGMFSLKPGNAKFREGPSLHAEWRGGRMSELNSKKNITENRVTDGVYLTLGSPTTRLQASTTKPKQIPAFHASHYRDYPEFDLLPYQESIEDHPTHQQGSSCSVQQQPFYSFFPPKGQIDLPAAATLNDRKGEVGDGVDLDLKL